MSGFEKDGYWYPPSDVVYLKTDGNRILAWHWIEDKKVIIGELVRYTNGDRKMRDAVYGELTL